MRNAVVYLYGRLRAIKSKPLRIGSMVAAALLVVWLALFVLGNAVFFVATTVEPFKPQHHTQQVETIDWNGRRIIQNQPDEQADERDVEIAKRQEAARERSAFICGVALGLVGLANLVLLVMLLFLGVLVALAFGIAWLNPTAGNLAFGFVVGVVVARIFAWLIRQQRQRLRRASAEVPGENTTFGSAKWATYDHLKKAGLILGDKPGYLLGDFQVGGLRFPITYAGDRHLLTVAPTRAGKGVASIIPNLLQHTGSALVIDPKGENARVTARQRAAMGQDVQILDPWGATGKWDIPGVTIARFNPLDWLDPNDPDIAENAYLLADSLIVPSNGENAFWDEEAKALLWGFILYVALDPAFAGPLRTLGTVRELMSTGAGRQGPMLQGMYRSTNPIVKGTAERTLAKDPKTKANVFTSLQAQAVFLDSPKIRHSLGASTFKFEDLKGGNKDGKPVTVYLVLPADRLTTYGRWLRLLIQQAITCNARNLGVPLAGGRPILFLLDEMAALGKLTKVEEAYGLMAGFGMQLWGIVQDLAQLDRIYDKGWETFIGNSGVLQYYGSRDEKTASYFSKLCGVTTVEKRSLTRSISRSLGFSTTDSTSSSSSSGAGGGSSSSSTSSSYGTSDSTTTGHSETADVVQRHLAFPDELMVLRKDQALLLVETFNPIDGRKVEWFKEERFKRLGVNIQGQPVPTPLLPAPDTLPPLVIPNVPEGGQAATTPPAAEKPAGTV